ncbi:MAG TPA: family 43 glycosylhydrolase [Geminicoccus sp.]|jgi:hypothetical protein|uniref:family 43 glycosylhydrolase n=1 Tax=Geminicoccus sp. TaxID=2024832 RepID=UPI002E31D781|nr:family 43 glycosylhydrolase [Geminicoccus sp.]HEX2527372.1 family 43 glycosylhydrolase [Geminicoccus sp.]
MTARDLALASTPQAPFRFDIRIVESCQGGLSWTVTLGEGSAGSGLARTCEYHLPTRQQSSYLDLFARLAQDMGTRVPRSRQEVGAPSFSAPYEPLLTENLGPGILYGYGDPAVIRVPEVPGSQNGGVYYLAVTSNDAPDAFPILASNDLRHWQPRGFIFPRERRPGWAADGEGIGDYWAPEIHRLGDCYLACFTARMKDRTLAIGMAWAPAPDGPFVAADEPLLRGGVIDPHVFVGRDGIAHLFWKEDTNDLWPGHLCELIREHGGLIAALFPLPEDQRTAALVQALWPWIRTLEPMERFLVLQVLIEAVTSDFTGFQRRLAELRPRQDQAVRERIDGMLIAMRTRVRAQRLAADGSRLLGRPTTVLENDQPWEAHLVEGIWVTEQAGRHYLLYAGNDFSTAEYGIGVAVAEQVLGPYRKMEQPLLRSTREWIGPGHPSVAPGLDGRPQLFLHAFRPGRLGYKEFRALLTVPLGFEADGVVLRRG